MPEMNLQKTYDFLSVEQRLYRWWEEAGYFTPRIDPDQKPFVISMPPPNITGELHLGHAMFVAVEDLMVRYNRMRGRPTLWLPGTDHAGIATQLQVEKHLLRTEEVTREEIGREAFLERTWNWREKYGRAITMQLRRLGASCDWTRERFTLDEGLSKAVREAFVRLYEKGLIYRGSYLINWSPGLRTAVSDLEVEYAEEQGKLYYFRYPIKGSDESIPVATTRPETILGDTAVAVHPQDERYQHFIGETCLVPMIGREIPVIADKRVDREFGTGALKITPGHDPADYEIGREHNLPIVSVMNFDATMNAEAGPYEGMDRFECREKLWADMKKAGLTIKIEPYTMQVPHSQRGGEIIEPMVSTQWFVRIKPLAEAALQAVRRGDVEIIPAHFTKVYYNWMENIRDWCISRQLWWGHRIPAWHCAECGEITVAREDPTRCASCGSTAIERDPDVLDTWFSSGLWPFSTLGWPDETEDLRYFYPTTVMETGYDILFFWVARMIMMGLEFTGEVPFHKVYLHGLVRVEGGQKMSKSLGNVQDPLELMEQYGTDALRFTLLTGSTPGQDMKMSLKKLEANRNFANKLWNAARLILGLMEQSPREPVEGDESSLADRWVLARLELLKWDVNRLLEAFQFGEAGRQIYEFFWGDFADWYLEIAKLQVRQGEAQAWRTMQNLVAVFDACLRMLHPYMPFVTEEIWGHIKRACEAHAPALTSSGGWEEALIVARWPEAAEERPLETAEIEAFDRLRAVVSAIRNLRAEKGVEPKRRIKAILEAGEATPMLADAAAVIAQLAGIDPQGLEIRERVATAPEAAVPLVVGAIKVYLPMRGLFDAQAERDRLKRQLSDIERQIARLEDLLAGPFAERAPKQVVQKEREKLAELLETAEQIKSQLTQLA